ncbi:MAG: Zn-ribbon domain-containing OB-fold protein [Myxococcota bacterium]
MSDAGTTGKSGDSKPVARPMPPRTELSQGFWDAVARGELAVQRCEACGLLRHYPQLRCPACQSAEVSWQPLSGEGEIHSYTVAHRAFHPAWKEHAPYVIATIELDEGVRMVCDLLGADPDTIAIGQRVRVRFEDLPGQGRMPRFDVVD